MCQFCLICCQLFLPTECVIFSCWRLSVGYHLGQVGLSKIELYWYSRWFRQCFPFIHPWFERLHCVLAAYFTYNGSYCKMMVAVLTLWCHSQIRSGSKFCVKYIISKFCFFLVLTALSWWNVHEIPYFAHYKCNHYILKKMFDVLGTASVFNFWLTCCSVLVSPSCLVLWACNICQIWRNSFANPFELVNGIA